MTRVLFIGNHLAKHNGTEGPIEKLAPHFPSIGIDAILVSSLQNKLFRLTHMFLCAVFCRYTIMHIDVYSGTAFKYALLCSKISKFRKKTVLLNLHGGKLTELYDKDSDLVHRLFRKADYIITPSLFLKSYFKSKKFNVAYIPNAVDLSIFPFNRDSVTPHSLLWVRAFSSIYSPSVAIESLLLLKKEFPDTKLTMVGPDKGKRREIEHLIKQHNIENAVTLTGPISNTALYKYYQTNSVFINTTQYESFGVSVVEAASCGIPIVSNKVGEIPYLWKNQENCLFVENNLPDQFCRQISKIFNDPTFGEALAKRAQEKASQFEIKAVVLQWKEMFQQMN